MTQISQSHTYSKSWKTASNMPIRSNLHKNYSNKSRRRSNSSSRKTKSNKKSKSKKNPKAYQQTKVSWIPSLWWASTKNFPPRFWFNAKINR